MPPKKISEEFEQAQQQLLEQQTQIDDLKDEVQRIHGQRNIAERENEILRVEIRRLKIELDKQIQNRTSNNQQGMTKTDVAAQTELVNINTMGVVNHSINYKTKQGGRVTKNNSLLNFDEIHINENLYKQKEYDQSNYYDNIQNNSQRDCQGELVKGMLNYFQSLQITVALSKFDGYKKNPVEFIKDLEKYFVKKMLHMNQKYTW